MQLINHHINKTIVRIISVLFCLILQINYSYSQDNSFNETFSPYTIFGLGDIVSPTNISQRAMGGVGITSMNPYEINYLNPASLGNIRQRSALFSFGGQMQNLYLQTNSLNQDNQSFSASDVGNNVSIHDIGFAIPLYRGIGFSVTMLPVTNVGYNTSIVDSNISNQIGGTAIYSYRGEGGISSVNANLGFKLARGLTIGGSFIYYFGSIDRYINTTIIPLLEIKPYSPIQSSTKTYISQISGKVGLQYALKVSTTGQLSFGATYQPETKIDAQTTNLVVSNNAFSSDTIRYNQYSEPYTLPELFSAGISFNTEKLNIATDYTYQDWSNAFEIPSTFQLNKQHTLRFGASYTPNKNDMRNPLNRWTYKVGAKYGTSYLSVINQKNIDYSVSLGAEIPLKTNSLSKLNIAFEYGKNNFTQNQQLKQSIFNIYIGFTFFGDDLWFEQRKFN